MFDFLAKDLSYTLRVLRRRPSLTVTAVMTLAFATAGASMIVGIVDALFFRAPAQVRAPNEVVRLYLTQDDPSGAASVSSVGNYPQYVSLRRGVRAFSEVAGVSSQPLSVGRGADAEELIASLVTASYFPLLGVRPAVGRLFTETDERDESRVAIISDGLWRRRFVADPGVLGRTISIGQESYSIVGVAPPGFGGISLEHADLWLPLRSAVAETGASLECTGCYWLGIIGRLQSGVSPARAASEATASIRHAAAREMSAASGVMVGPIQEARGPNGSREARVTLWISAIALLLLLIACGNVASLLLARTLERQGEIAVRLALGAERRQLVRQLALEGLVLSLGGCVAGLLLAQEATPVLASYLLPTGVSEPLIDSRVLGFSAALALLITVLISVAPALRVARTELVLTLNSADRARTSRRSRERAAILVGQVAVALVLLVGAGLFIESFRRVAALPLGFEPDHLIAANADFQALGYRKADIDLLYRRIQTQVKRLPGIANAALAIGSPFRVSMAIPLDVPGVPDSMLTGQMGAAYFQAVSPEYFATLGTRVLRGRAFLDSDVRGAPLVALVNRTMGQWLWRGGDPLGRCIKLSVGSCRTVIGVVEEVRRYSLTEPPTMQYYVPLAQADSLVKLSVTAMLVRTTGRPETTIQPLRRMIQRVSPTLPYFSVMPAADLFDWELRPRRLGALVVSLFGGLAAVMAAVGLYGALVYSVTQRTRELGIRSALGASRFSIVALVMREGFTMIVLGILLGAIAILLLYRVVASRLPEIASGDSTVLLGAAALLALIGVVASVAPARRATRVDPIRALTHD